MINKFILICVLLLVLQTKDVLGDSIKSNVRTACTPCRVISSGDGYITCYMGGGTMASIKYQPSVTVAKRYPQAGRFVVLYITIYDDQYVLYDWFRNGYFPFGKSNDCK